MSVTQDGRKNDRTDGQTNEQSENLVSLLGYHAIVAIYLLSLNDQNTKIS